MSGRAEGACAAHLDLVLFQVGGVRYGTDADLLASIEVLQERVEDDLRWCHEVLGFPASRSTYMNPVVLTLRGLNTRIVVDGLEDIIRIPLSMLSPFPPLTESMARARGLWAVAKGDGHLILLVDFHLLAAGIDRFPLETEDTTHLKG
jgi:hypothetical protein